MSRVERSSIDNSSAGTVLTRGNISSEEGNLLTQGIQGKQSRAAKPLNSQKQVYGSQPQPK